MAWVSSTTQQSLDFTQIIFNSIQSIVNAKSDIEYFENVERLADLLFPYYDDSFNIEFNGKEFKPKLTNPWFNEISEEKKKAYARKLFRALVALIHRSGFLPEKRLEGILDEQVIDAIFETTAPRRKESHNNIL